MFLYLRFGNMVFKAEGLEGHIAECHAVNGLREGGRLLLRLLSIVDGVSVR